MSLYRSLACLLSFLCVVGQAQHLGFVDFHEVLTQSQFAKKEEQALQALRVDLEGQVTKVEQEIAKLGKQLNDPDFTDSLSHEALLEKKTEHEQLVQQRMQLIQAVSQQYQQAQQRFFSSMAAHVSSAAEVIAKEHHFEAVCSKEVLFYAEPSADCTAAVIRYLDAHAQKEQPAH